MKTTTLHNHTPNPYPDHVGQYDPITARPVITYPKYTGNSYEQVSDIHKQVARNIKAIVMLRFIKFYYKLCRSEEYDPYVYVDVSNTCYKIKRYTDDQIQELKRREEIDRRNFEVKFHLDLEAVLSEVDPDSYAATPAGAPKNDPN